MIFSERFLDKFGLPVVLLAFFLSALYAPFVFLGGSDMALIGMILWGVGVGAQDSLLKSILAGIIPAEKRGTAFGLFDTGFGFAWFIGSASMGLLYEISIPSLILFSIVLQLTALPFLVIAERG
ncbi:MAG TPA: MFS transporter [Syntrophales bacterium]|nr:MFS transporter [Syntrophales bacterium]